MTTTEEGAVHEMQSMTPPSADTSAGYEAGMVIRRQVMGDDFVDRAMSSARGTPAAALQEFVTEHVWGGVWTRDGLQPRSRSLLNIGILTALRADVELSGHIRGALNNGLSRDEIAEAIIHTVGYCGAPAALSAMRVARQVFDTIENSGPTQDESETDRPTGNF